MTCLICKFNQSKIIFSYDKPDDLEIAVGVKEKNYFRKWLQCKKCGFYYSIYSRGENVMNKVYSSAYRDNSKSWRKEGSTEEVFQKVIALPEQESVTKLRIKWIKETINAIWEGGLLKRARPPYKMLDIGGGTGIFAYEFHDNNWKSYVVDPSKGNEFIKTKLKIPLIQTFYKPNIFKKKFNLISMIYILEHLLNPISFLKNVYSDMAPNSFLFIEVPDAINFKLKSAQDDIFHSEHLWIFSPKTLSSILERCGFEVFGLKRLKTKRDHYVLMILATNGNKI